MNRWVRGTYVLAAAAALLAGCGKSVPVGDALFDAEVQKRKALRETSIALSGRLVAPQ